MLQFSFFLHNGLILSLAPFLPEIYYIFSFCLLVFHFNIFLSLFPCLSFFILCLFYFCDIIFSILPYFYFLWLFCFCLFCFSSPFLPILISFLLSSSIWLFCPFIAFFLIISVFPFFVFPFYFSFFFLSFFLHLSFISPFFLFEMHFSGAFFFFFWAFRFGILKCKIWS